jgi:ammonium transporter, Amt family
MQLSVGSVRSKNAKNIILKNLLDACFGAICFYFVGYAFAFGGDVNKNKGNVFIGWEGFALNNISKAIVHKWFWQYTVCSPLVLANSAVTSKIHNV